MSGQSIPNPSRQRVFGPFAFDEAAGELRKHGIRVRLQGQPLQILATLIRQPGVIVTRDELHQRLWKGSTFVDFDHGLHAAMSRLRQALGDAADRPRYIETLTGRGYRFIAAVQDFDPKPILVLPLDREPSPQIAAPPPQSFSAEVVPARKQMWWLWTALTVGLLSFAGSYVSTVQPRQKSGAQRIRFSIAPPPGFVLEAGSSRQTFALSPDGSRLAFSAVDSSGMFQMFLRDLNGLDVKALPNSLGAYHVFWAPDSRSLFLTLRGEVRRYAFEGDSYQVICDTPAIMLTGVLMGTDLLISARLGNFLVSASGGPLRPLKEVLPWPQVMPDDKHVLYTFHDPASRHHSVRVVEWGKPETARELLQSDSRAVYTPSLSKPGSGYLVYVRAGNLLAHPFDARSLRVEGTPSPVASRIYSWFPTGAADFSVSENGILAYRPYLNRSQLAWVNRHGQVLKKIGPQNVNLKLGRLSPDGKKIATSIFNVDRGVSEMWIVDTTTGASRRAFLDTAQVDGPVWSPDSAKLAFLRASEGPPKLYIRGLGENDSLDPLPQDFYQIPTDWSADGRFLAFTNSSFVQTENEMRGDVWLIDMARQRRIIPLISTPFHEGAPSFSPDGRWLAFISNESGRAEVYIQAFEASDTPHLTGERHLVSGRGAVALRWRRDGKELFYLAFDGHVYSVPITLAREPKIGEASPLFTISTEARAAAHSMLGFDVSRDGQQFLIPIVAPPDKSEIVIIPNWESAIQH